MYSFAVQGSKAPRKTNKHNKFRIGSRQQETAVELVNQSVGSDERAASYQSDRKTLDSLNLDSVDEECINIDIFPKGE